MRPLIIIFILLSAVIPVNGQAYGNRYIAPKAGGGRVVIYDTITPLVDLINRFEKPWELRETGKGYWIGYTNDMYSVARYQDKAIGKLTDFIDTSRNLHAKQAALFTLHLIGINCRVVGRFIEDFENQEARNALLKYLNDSELNQTVAYLIKRDPWLSDIPQIMRYLSITNNDCSNVLTALQRYNFDGKPLEQIIPDDPFEKNIYLNDPDFSGLHSIEMLIAFQKALEPYLTIDTEITASPEGQKATNSTSSEGHGGKLSFNFVVESSKTFSYCDSENSYDYTFKDHKVEIIGQKKARQIWLDWWIALSQSDKEQLFASNHIPFGSKR
jgi:hypothetical protein